MYLRSKKKQKDLINKRPPTPKENNKIEANDKKVASGTMATGTEYRRGEGDSLILQEIRNGNRTLSDKLDSQTAEINKSISGLKTMLDKLTSRVTEVEDLVGKAEDRLDQVDTRVNKLREENDFL